MFIITESDLYDSMKIEHTEHSNFIQEIVRLLKYHYEHDDRATVKGYIQYIDCGGVFVDSITDPTTAYMLWSTHNTLNIDTIFLVSKKSKHYSGIKNITKPVPMEFEVQDGKSSIMAKTLLDIIRETTFQLNRESWEKLKENYKKGFEELDITDPSMSEFLGKI